MKIQIELEMRKDFDILIEKYAKMGFRSKEEFVSLFKERLCSLLKDESEYY